jgi:hypothetical protein
MGFLTRQSSSLPSLSCLGCQPDRGTGTWAARVPGGSQVLCGYLLPDSGGTTPPAVSQVRIAQLAGGIV